jgi:hypothetical protein
MGDPHAHPVCRANHRLSPPWPLPLILQVRNRARLTVGPFLERGLSKPRSTICVKCIPERAFDRRNFPKANAAKARLHLLHRPCLQILCLLRRGCRGSTPRHVSSGSRRRSAAQLLKWCSLNFRSIPTCSEQPRCRDGRQIFTVGNRLW